MCCEITITLKDSERTYKKKFLVYEKVVLDISDDIVQRLLEETRKEFNGEVQDAKIVAVITI